MDIFGYSDNDIVNSIDGNFTGDVVISGNLQVEGDEVISNVAKVEIEDPLLHLGKNNSGDIVDAGWYSEYTSGGKKYAGLIRDATDSKFYLTNALTSLPAAGINYSPFLGDLNVKNITTDTLNVSTTITTPQVINTGSNMTVGTEDNQTLILKTNNTPAITFDNTTASFGRCIRFPGDSRKCFAKVYDEAAGDVFGLEQVSAVQSNLGIAQTRLFTANSADAGISFGKYTGAETFIDFAYFTNAGDLMLNNNFMLSDSKSICFNGNDPSWCSGLNVMSMNNINDNFTTSTNSLQMNIAPFDTHTFQVNNRAGVVGRTMFEVKGLSGDTQIAGNLKTKVIECDGMTHMTKDLAWNPANKSILIGLSNNNLTAACGSSAFIKYVKSNTAIKRAKRATYYVKIDSFSGNHCMIGLAQGTLNVDAQVDYKYSVWYNCNNGDSGDYINNAGGFVSAAGPAVNAGDIVKLVNDGNGNLVFYKDNLGDMNFSIMYSRSYALPAGDEDLFLYVGDGSTGVSGFQATIISNIDFKSNVVVPNVYSAGQLRGYGYRVDNTNTVAVVEDDEVVCCSYSTTGVVAVNLPAISTLTRLYTKYKRFVVKDTSGNAGANNITINRGGADLIDGATTKVINTNYGHIILVNDGGTNWWVIS